MQAKTQGHCLGFLHCLAPDDPWNTSEYLESVIGGE
jgi:hypothetical protein